MGSNLDMSGGFVRLSAMSFVEDFNALPMEALLREACGSTRSRVTRVLSRSARNLEDFATLLSPEAAQDLEVLGQKSRTLTQQRFGRVMRLFAPLYLSNECVNNCQYCGFSRDNPILRVSLADHDDQQQQQQKQQQQNESQDQDSESKEDQQGNQQDEQYPPNPLPVVAAPAAN